MAEWEYRGTGLPIDRGHGVKHHNVSAAQKGASARLYDQEGDHISLWVYEIEANFEMAGTTVQGPKQRDFYPHHFVQPAFKVRGQTANNFEYNRLSEFIRQTQRRAVFYDAHNLDKPTISLVLFKGGHDTKRNHKGAHQALSLQGFVPKFGRGAKRFEFMHDFEFDFIVTVSENGLMKDTPYTALALLSWAEVVFKHPSQNGFVEDPTAYYLPDRPPLTDGPGDNGQVRPT